MKEEDLLAVLKAVKETAERKPKRTPKRRRHLAHQEQVAAV